MDNNIEHHAGKLARRPKALVARVEFGPFSLRSQGSMLYRGEEPVRLGSRALHILAVLTASAGEVVFKADLIAEVWPDVIVAESNLTVHISALRQALGDGQDNVRYIVNVPGRGYCFVAPVRRPVDEGHAASALPAVASLPGLRKSVVGLSKAAADVAAKLDGSSLVTLVGPAGVGKTTLALHVAHAQQSRLGRSISFIEFASVREAGHIVPAIATTMRIELGPGEPTATLVASLGRSQALVVLDNCEHLIEPIAALAALIGQRCPEVVLLATSREPLRIVGETVYRLAPLESPPHAKTLTAKAAMAYPAVQLFVEQAGAATNELTLIDEDAPAAALICRRLDGLPLAIQFASALVPTFGIGGLAARLDDRLKLLQTGLRGAPDRHRTLAAALDWSYGLLEEEERRLLRRLAIFVSGFTLEAAASVVGVQDSGNLNHLLASLYAKSLVTRNATASNLRFALLETTRAYTHEKLNQAEELDRFSLNHAEYFADLLNQAWNNKKQLFNEGGYANLSDHLGDVLAALEWSFSPAGQADLAVKLAAAAGVYFCELGILTEAREWTRRALSIIDDAQRDTHDEMLLQFGLAYATMVSIGNTAEATLTVKRALELANLLGDYDLHIRVLSGYHMYLSRTGDNKAAMQLALHAADVASQSEDSDAIGIADTMLSRSYYYAGDQEKALACVHSVFKRLPLDRQVNTIRFGNDPRIRALACKAGVLWVTGHAQQARDCVLQLLQCAARIGDPVVVIQGYYAASLIAVQLSDLGWATKLVSELKKHLLDYAYMPFPILAASLELELAFRKTPPATAKELLPLLTSFSAVRGAPYNPAFHGIAVIEGLTQVGLLAEASVLLNDLVDEMIENGQGLYRPEYLRLKGDILAAQTEGETDSATRAYEQAIQLAREQSALAWELRAATSLARFHAHDRELARSILQPVYRQSRKDLETGDLISARSLLATLGPERKRALKKTARIGARSTDNVLPPL